MHIKKDGEGVKIQKKEYTTNNENYADTLIGKTDKILDIFALNIYIYINKYKQRYMFLYILSSVLCTYMYTCL